MTLKSTIINPARYQQAKCTNHAVFGLLHTRLVRYLSTKHIMVISLQDLNLAYRVSDLIKPAPTATPSRDWESDWGQIEGWVIDRASRFDASIKLEGAREGD